MPVFSLRLPETLEADARAGKLPGLEFQSMRLFVSQLIRICGVALQPVAEPAASPTPTPTPSRLRHLLGNHLGKSVESRTAEG